MKLFKKSPLIVYIATAVNFNDFYTFIMFGILVLRCLGIPCRSVTNFNSAHDTNNNISKDIYLDDESNEIEHKSSDTIW